MYLNFVILIQFFFGSLIGLNNDSLNLKVNITGIEKISGSARVCLIGDDKTKYLKGCDLSKVVKVDGRTVNTIFENLPAGTYCISVYHDIDDDEKLSQKGLFGLPSEPYGFSNNPRSLFGPPKLEKCQFTLKDNLEITIDL